MFIDGGIVSSTVNTNPAMQQAVSIGAVLINVCGNVRIVHRQ